MYREVRGLHQAAYILGLFAFSSQLLALVRDRLLAHQFGAGTTLDIYYASFRLPDLLFVLFASTLSVYVLIPFVARARERGGDTEAQQLLKSVFTLFLIAYVVAAVVLFFMTPMLMARFFPGILDQEQMILITRILLLQPFLLGLSSLFGVVTQLGHRFILYALSPLVYNLGIIFGIAVLYPFWGLAGLAWGVVLGALGHLLIQVPLVQKSSLSLGLTGSMDLSSIRSVLAVSVPRAITLSFNQVVLLVLMSLASVMTAGSVSVFQFGFNLQSVPLAVIGVSYSVAAFPLLAQLHAEKSMKKFELHVMTAIRHIIFWAVPATALIIVLRAHIVRVVLGSGAFDWSDTRLTAAVLAVLAISLVAQAINLLAVRAFYAAGKTRLPFYIILVTSALAMYGAYYALTLYSAHQALQVTVANFMRLADVVGSEVLAIAFGYTLAMLLQTIILLAALWYVFSFSFGWLFGHLVRCFSAAALGGISAYAALNFLVDGINPETFIGILIQGSLAGVIGVTGVILAYIGLSSPEIKEVYGAFQRRLWRTDVVAPQEEVL